MQVLLNQIYEISKKHEEINKISGSNFNIFNVIDVTTDEVRLHSRFIAELLNPLGSHGQNDIFLNLFCKEFSISNFSTQTSIVEIEKFIGEKTNESGGRIDIFIDDQKGNSIVIENKIYARDQENQLVRYYNYSSNNVFYLNLYGDMPSDNSFGTLEIKENFRIISYRTDILSWLEQCRKESVELPLLREGISHYINLVKTFTGQSNNINMSKEITNLITSSPEQLEKAIILSQNLNSAKIKIQWSFWEKLKECFKLKDITFKEDESASLKKVEAYYKTKRNNKNYGLYHEIFSKGDLKIYYGIQIDNVIYYGFLIEKDGKGGISDLKEYEKYSSMLKSIDTNYEPTPWWLGWKYPQLELNFREFNSEEIYQLVNEDSLTKTVEQIVNDSVYAIDEFKKKLSEMI